jgi:PhoH-like ATPase
MEDKMHPWLQPIHDAFQYLVASANGKKSSRRNAVPCGAAPAASPLRQFVQAGVIEVQPLCYIRGRSIAHRYFLLDEAQQLTPAEAKTAVTRMGSGAKLVLVGDPDQTDHPALDSWSNGLSYTQRRLANLPFAAHLELRKGERSTLAEAAARLM